MAATAALEDGGGLGEAGGHVRLGVFELANNGHRATFGANGRIQFAAATHKQGATARYDQGESVIHSDSRRRPTVTRTSPKSGRRLSFLSRFNAVAVQRASPVSPVLLKPSKKPSSSMVKLTEPLQT